MATAGDLSMTCCVSRKTLTWKITDFMKQCIKSGKTGTLKSNCFLACNTTWYLSIDGEENEDSWQFHIFLNAEGCDDHGIFVHCICTVFSKDPGSKELTKLKSGALYSWFKVNSSSWGFRNLVELPRTQQSDIVVELSLRATKRAEDLLYFESDEEENALRRFLRSGTAHDVIFLVGDREFPAHRDVLGVRSPVFKDLFNKQMTEAPSKKMVITDTDPEVFEHFLEFLYTGIYPTFIDCQAENLFILADKYQICPLQELCRVHFEKDDWDEKTAIRWFLFARNYPSLGFMKERLVVYLKKNPEFIDTDEWKAVEENNPSAAAELLRLFIKL